MSKPKLGTIVSWRVPSSVSIDALRQAMRQAQIPERLASDMKPGQALMRALRDMRAGRVIQKLEKDDEDTVKFQLTRVRVSNDEAEYDREALVRLHVPTCTVMSDSSEVEARARQLLTEHIHKRTTNDLTRLVQRVFDEHKADLVPIRDHGGVYFVPEAHSDLVDRVRLLLDAIGGRLRTFSVRMSETGHDATDESVAESLAEHLNDLVRQLRESCQNIGPDSRKDAIGNREADIAELRTKLECYRDLLSVYAGKIQEEIDLAERELLSRIIGNVASPREDLLCV